MLLKAGDLKGDAVLAEDGEVGAVDDLYFHDEDWDVRYLVVDARRWIPGRRYLVSPIAIDGPMDPGDEIHVELTRDQVSRCPQAAAEPRLRLLAEVIGCGMEATDGEVGAVADLVIDDETWAISDVLVDSREWLPGKLLLVAPAAIERIDWRLRKVRLRLTREAILQAPEIDV